MDAQKGAARHETGGLELVCHAGILPAPGLRLRASARGQSKVMGVRVSGFCSP